MVKWCKLCFTSLLLQTMSWPWPVNCLWALLLLLFSPILNSQTFESLTGPSRQHINCPQLHLFWTFPGYSTPALAGHMPDRPVQLYNCKSVPELCNIYCNTMVSAYIGYFEQYCNAMYPTPPDHIRLIIKWPGTLPAQYADSVDLKDGLLTNRVCTVKFHAIEAYFSSNTIHTEVPSTRMDLEVWWFW